MLLPTPIKLDQNFHASTGAQVPAKPGETRLLLICDDFELLNVIDLISNACESEPMAIDLRLLRRDNLEPCRRVAFIVGNSIC